MAINIICSHHVVTSLSFSTNPSTTSRSLSNNLHNKPSSYKWHRRSHTFTSSALYSSNKGSDDLIKTLLLNNDVSDDTDPFSRYTHQIAIPLGETAELHSALTAIQTSLVRDCPRLIRACIVPALLRMPLLYVDGSSLESSGGGSSIIGGDGKVDAIIEEVVSKAIRNVVYEEDTDIVGPIMLPFQGLELQGDDNSILYAVGNNVNEKKKLRTKKNQFLSDDDDDDDEEVYIVEDWTETKNVGLSGWEMLEKLVYHIQNELEGKYGLETSWPLDNAQVEADFAEEEGDDPLVAAIKQKQKRKWRPRVPFVRLPSDFYDDLKADTEKKKNDEYDEEDEPSFIDMGFDGISPLFWYEAWGGEDIFLPPGVRMQSVAVYRRMVPGGGESESSFYVPTSAAGSQTWKSGINVNIEKKNNISMDLPSGNAKLRAREKSENAKANQRLGEVEQREEREWEEGKARWMDELNDQIDDDDDDTLAQFDVGMEVGEITVEGDAAYSTPWTERDLGDDGKSSTTMSYSELVEKSLSADPKASTDKEQSQSDSTTMTPQPVLDMKPRKDLPSIEDNPVFKRLWTGKSQITSKGQNTAMALDGTPPSKDESLPPYPSDAHFLGAWRIVSFNDDASSQPSDNFILRVDGQVMGGPVLDADYKHKAAGGEWRMFQAVRKSSDADSKEIEASPPITQTRLRIKLLIPPEKERFLIMEGEVTRMIMPGGGDVSSSDGWMLPNGGLLDGMLPKMMKEDEGLLYCGGEAWMEDVEGGGNRRKVGTFSLMKLKAIKTENLIYTVDISRPKEVEDEETNE